MPTPSMFMISTGLYLQVVSIATEDQIQVTHGDVFGLPGYTNPQQVIYGHGISR